MKHKRFEWCADDDWHYRWRLLRAIELLAIMRGFAPTMFDDGGMLDECQCGLLPTEDLKLHLHKISDMREAHLRVV